MRISIKSRSAAWTRVVFTATITLALFAAPGGLARADSSQELSTSGATQSVPLSQIPVPKPGNTRLSLYQLDDATCDYNVHGIYICSADFEGHGL